MKRTLKLLIISALALGIFSFVRTPAAHAATLTVNSTADVQADDGSCTLREAIIAINNATSSGAASGECVAGDGNDDTITLPIGTITLNADLPTITESAIVQGQGMGQTVVNGVGNYRIFRTDRSGDTLQLSDLTVKAWYQRCIDASSTNLSVKRVEVDGIGGSDSGEGGISAFAEDGGTYTVGLEDLYIHDVPTNSYSSTAGINTGAASGSTLNLTVDRATVAGIFDSTHNSANGITITAGFLDSALTPGTVNAVLRNVTVSNVTSSTANATGISLAGAINGGEANITANATNITITDLDGEPGLFPTGSIAVVVAGMALGASDEANLTLDLTNGLVDGVCAAQTIAVGPTPAGVHNLSLNSLGGNISNDASCAPFLNDDSDQNNIGNLTSTLGTLSNNGGYVPTIPLLEDSPAIDAGVNVSGLTTDARLAARPQGNAFDSGAYESSFTRTTTTSPDESLASTGESTRNFVLIGALLAVFGIGAFALSTRKR